jgi:hypothetical protein
MGLTGRMKMKTPAVYTVESRWAEHEEWEHLGTHTTLEDAVEQAALPQIGEQRRILDADENELDTFDGGMPLAD